MADVEDVQEYERKFQNQLDKLDEADIPDDDRESIREFIRREDGRGGISTGTIISNLNRLRLSAERSDIPLTEAEKSDVDELLFKLKHDHGLADSTRREYRKALRKFYDWRGEPWAEDIRVGPPETNSVDSSELLTREEIDVLLHAAEQPRDKAVLALLADTGLRIGAIASLRIRDLDLSSNVGIVRINENANVKDAEGTIPLTWSQGYIANWLDVHPRNGQLDAPLVHQLRGYYDGEDDGALTYQYLSRRIKEIGERAGIDPSRLNTHNFRKSAITRWVHQGLSEQEIKHRALWVKDSRQFETYSGVTDEQMNRKIAERYGLATEDREVAKPSIEECPQCQTPLRENSRFCPGCGAPLTADAAGTAESIDDDIIESLAGDLDERETETIIEFREMIKNNPALQTLLLEG